MLRTLAFGIAFAVACATVAPAAKGQSLGADERAAALIAIEDAIRAHYVFEERVPGIIARIKQARAARRYDVTSPVQFARLVSEDLEAVSHDGHLYLRDDPDRFTAASQPGKEDSALDAYRKAEAQRANSGLDRFEILPGNVRYLRITQFRWDPETTPQGYAEAARFLRGGDAIILDLRDNGGGTSDAADLFNKMFLPPNPKHVEAPGASGRDPVWADKPIYILINAGTGSAAEAVSYNAKAEGVATIVGMTSYGAANNNRYVPIAPRFILSVSERVPIHPITGTNWEGVGVVPDLAISSERALAAAHADALARLRRRPGITDAQRAALDWELVRDRAVMDPPLVDPDALAGYAGCYGPVQLRATPAGLRFFRNDRPKRPQGVTMHPLDGSGLFAIDGYIDLRLRAYGGKIELFHGSDEARQTFERSPCGGSPVVD
jgi:hypothetical protein